jgi:protoheme IX farnesyltransferase
MQKESFAPALRDYITLTKPEVNLLILMTTSAAYYLAAPKPMHVAGLVHTLIGTLLVASGTATLNQWMERGWDGQMRRTATRPLPAKRISSAAAAWFGILLSLAGGVYLAVAVNRLAAILAVSTLLSYLFIYTPLKRKTPLCTFLGAFPGAMPVLIGWAGGAATISREAWFLFALLFLWQFPHFLAIALMYREDYARAGYKMLPDFDADSRFTRAEILGCTVILVLVSLLPTTGRVGSMYGIGALAAGSFFMYYVIRLTKSNSRALATQVLHASVIYLPVVLGLMVFSKP